MPVKKEQKSKKIEPEVKGAAKKRESKPSVVLTDEELSALANKTIKECYIKTLNERHLSVVRTSKNAKRMSQNALFHKIASKVRKAVLLMQARGKVTVSVADVELPLPPRNISLYGFNAHVTYRARKRKNESEKSEDGGGGEDEDVGEQSDTEEPESATA